jgi:hypothetical protein
MAIEFVSAPPSPSNIIPSSIKPEPLVLILPLIGAEPKENFVSSP